jgi:hypothetical protein
MYVNSDTDTERSLCIEKMLADLPGGGTVEPDDFKSDTDTLLEGALLGVDSNGLYHLVKTAKIYDGGSASAPRIYPDHELKVDDIISDGNVALEIDEITEETDYDTLRFTSGELTISDTGTILYQVETEDTDGTGNACEATVEDTADDYLTVSFPLDDNPEQKNGIILTIAQNGSDALAVAYTGGTLTVSLAKSTASKNNVAEIQAAIRALAVEEGIDFSSVVCTGVDWDGNQDGSTLTTASDTFTGGANISRKDPLYTPSGIATNSVDLSSDVANMGCGIMVSGIVIEALMPYYVDANIKALLPHVLFK